MKNPPTTDRRRVLNKNNVRVHGSVYPGASQLQRADYARVVADNQRKRKAQRKAEEDAAA